jgi:malonate transporter
VIETAVLVLPNFALILLGLVLSRRFAYARAFWEGLEKLVYYVLFPALLLRSLALARIDPAATGLLIACALGFTLAGFVLSLVPGLFGVERRTLATGSQCAYRFNTYIGLAVAGSLFGSAGVALAALLLGAMIPLVNVTAVAMLAAHGRRGLFLELATNPLLVSTLAGFAWNAGGVAVPGFIDQTLALLGQASLPAGLLCVGAAMRLERGAGSLALHGYWLALKLAIIPCIALVLIHAFRLQGMGTKVLLLCAALPTATNAYILAVRMAGDGRAAALQITLGTLASMATLPIWMAV